MMMASSFPDLSDLHSMLVSAWGTLVRVQLTTTLVLSNPVLQNYCVPCMFRRAFKCKLFRLPDS
jgi:hypothetical protein